MTGWEGVFPVLLIIVALALLAWHGFSWRTAQANLSHDSAEWAFRRRQFPRRLQVSGMLLVVGVLLLLGQTLFPQTEHPWWAIAYWLVVALVTVWMVLLALADMLAGVFFFGQLKNQADIEQIRLSTLADRLRRVHGNGKDKEENLPSNGKR